VTLADQILPLVRSRTDLHRWRAANAYGIQLHDAVTLLLDAAENEPPAEVLAVTQKAIASACKVIMRADDSSGIIGNAIRQLLGLHAQLARVAPPPYRKLVDWMIRFQFECDYFEIDPVAYAPALGERGLAAYRAKLDEIAAGLSPKLSDEQQRNLWSTDRAAWSRRVEEDHTRFVLEWNDRRLAVWDKDVDAIIVTHSRDRKVAVWLEDTAEALPRSASSTSPSTGPDRPPGSTSATRPPRRPATGARCWPRTVRTTNCPPGWTCSGAGRRHRTRPHCTSGPPHPGRPTPTR
jgi:hypothetical protein